MDFGSSEFGPNTHTDCPLIKHGTIAHYSYRTKTMRSGIFRRRRQTMRHRRAKCNRESHCFMCGPYVLKQTLPEIAPVRSLLLRSLDARTVYIGCGLECISSERAQFLLLLLLPTFALRIPVRVCPLICRGGARRREHAFGRCSRTRAPYTFLNKYRRASVYDGVDFTLN